MVDEKSSAHGAVARAIAKGKLVRPDRCDECGMESKRIIGHHEDYSKPLDVEWLCPKCHAGKHPKWITRMRSEVNKASSIRMPREAWSLIDECADRFYMSRSRMICIMACFFAKNWSGETPREILNEVIGSEGE
jgi:hypothetical protein